MNTIHVDTNISLESQVLPILSVHDAIWARRYDAKR